MSFGGINQNCPINSLPQRLLQKEGEELNLLRGCEAVPLTDGRRGVPLAVPLHPLVLELVKGRVI